MSVCGGGFRGLIRNNSSLLGLEEEDYQHRGGRKEKESTTTLLELEVRRCRNSAKHEVSVRSVRERGEHPATSAGGWRDDHVEKRKNKALISPKGSRRESERASATCASVTRRGLVLREETFSRERGGSLGKGGKEVPAKRVFERIGKRESGGTSQGGKSPLLHQRGGGGVSEGERYGPTVRKSTSCTPGGKGEGEGNHPILRGSSTNDWCTRKKGRKGAIEAHVRSTSTAFEKSACRLRVSLPVERRRML